MDEIRVFLVDDHRVVRTGLVAYLGGEPGMCVVGQAPDGVARWTRLPCWTGAVSDRT